MYTNPITRQPGCHYCYPILIEENHFYNYDDNVGEATQHQYHPSSAYSPHYLQDQRLITVYTEKRKAKDPYLKRILIVDDDPDITLTFKVGLEEYYYYHDDKRKFEVYVYNNPVLAILEFKPNFYDMLLIDVYMPEMNGFEFCEKVLELDINIRICFISSADVNVEALREVYPKSRSIGCFIKKPASIEYLAKRLSAELD